MRLSPTHLAQAGAGLALWCLLLVTAWLYAQGLSDAIIFDDKPNLEDLASIAESPWRDRLHFVLQGDSGPLGRPLALLSFALQAHHWPDATAFKSVNIHLHLLTGSLVFWLCLALATVLKLPSRRAYGLALLCAGLWLLSPIQVSTVLYVVQRMAQLSALFTVAGLLAYTLGRQLLARGRMWAGYAATTLGLGLGGLLAVLAKENGVLILLYILALEWTLFQGWALPPYWRWWRGLALYTPVVVLLGYFGLVHDYAAAYAVRDFSMGERLLTEARVLPEYLGKILLPRPHVFSLFHDDYVISRGLLQPLTTLPGVLLVLGGLGAALWLRRRQPVFAFAVLWFAAGHALESTALGLVIYFEHRNYLALLGPLFALVYGFGQLLRHSALSGFLRRSLRVAGGLWLGWVALVCASEIWLWRTPLTQALYWAEQHPRSRYAQSYAPFLLLKQGQPEAAVAYYRNMSEVFPQDAAPLLFWQAVNCLYPEVPAPSRQPALEHLRHRASNGEGAVIAVAMLRHSYLRRPCSALAEGGLENLLDALLANPNLHRQRGELLLEYAQLSGALGRYDLAVSQIDQAEREAKSVSALGRLFRLSWLTEAGRYPEALAYIAQLRRDFDPRERWLYAEHLDYMDATVRGLLAPTPTPAGESAP